MNKISSLGFVLLATAGCAALPGRTEIPTLPATVREISTATITAPSSDLPKGFTILLGRPTDTSVAVSLESPVALQAAIDYGRQAGMYGQQVGPFDLTANTPQTIEITGLQADSQYYYRVTDGVAVSAEHRFHTWRPAGEAFTFTIDADPHNRDPNVDMRLYSQTLAGVLADRPDFHFNLGDTFMTEKVKPDSLEQAAASFIEMRSYFGLFGADAPLFLVNGNHDAEVGWPDKKSSPDLPVWAAQMRQLYYPVPRPGGFYSSSETVDLRLGEPRDGYYSFTWGDALFVALDPYWYTTVKPSPDSMQDNWNWTLGREQYDWLKSTLENSRSKYKFVFIHHLVGGSSEGRGGVEFARLFEWGGYDPDGSYAFDRERPGWGWPIHQLLVENRVSAVFHGHDHVFVKQELDGIVYQECPQPDAPRSNQAEMAQKYGYTQGEIIPGSGYLRVEVSTEGVTVEFIREYLPEDKNAARDSGKAAFSYQIR